jgi:predicted ATP-grasp superfamily ATP-dependent carboligase
MDRPLRILVTDGGSRPALAITRSLGKKGHHIVVGEKAQRSLAQASRYCAESLVYPEPIRDSGGFVETLLQAVRGKNIDVLLPVTEVTTSLILSRKEEFERFCRLPFPDIATFDLAANKVELIALADKLLVPTPISVVMRHPGDRSSWPEQLQFPLVIKPHRSRVCFNGQWQSMSVTYAESSTELEAILASKKAYEYPLLLQQRIVGPGVGTFLCYQRGECVAVFGHKRLREKPPSGGVSTLCESVVISSEALAHAQALLNHLRWHGVAMVEFKVDEADKQLKLMEINGRFWGSLQLAIDAGVDFPALLLETMSDTAMKPLSEYRIGVRSRWFLGDLDALIMRLIRTDAELHLPPDHEGRFRSLWNFIAPGPKKTYNEIARFFDLKPAFHEASQWFRQGLK